MELPAVYSIDNIQDRAHLEWLFKLDKRQETKEGCQKIDVIGEVRKTS